LRRGLSSWSVRHGDGHGEGSQAQPRRQQHYSHRNFQQLRNSSSSSSRGGGGPPSRSNLSKSHSYDQVIHVDGLHVPIMMARKRKLSDGGEDQSSIGLLEGKGERDIEMGADEAASHNADGQAEAGKRPAAGKAKTPTAASNLVVSPISSVTQSIDTIKTFINDTAIVAANHKPQHNNGKPTTGAMRLKHQVFRCGQAFKRLGFLKALGLLLALVCVSYLVDALIISSEFLNTAHKGDSCNKKECLFLCACPSNQPPLRALPSEPCSLSYWPALFTSTRAKRLLGQTRNNRGGVFRHLRSGGLVHE
jgi:hypothetical protein